MNYCHVLLFILIYLSKDKEYRLGFEIEQRGEVGSCGILHDTSIRNYNVHTLLQVSEFISNRGAHVFAEIRGSIGYIENVMYNHVELVTHHSDVENLPETNC